MSAAMPPDQDRSRARFQPPPAIVAVLILFAIPATPSLAADLTAKLTAVRPLAEISGSLPVLKAGAEAGNVESPIPQPDTEIAISEPQPAPDWPLWPVGLAIPMLGGSLWWLVTREAKGLGLGGSPAALPASASNLAANSVQQAADPAPDGSEPSSELQDWLRLTSQAAGELQASWKISAARRLELRQQGGRKLMLHLHEATGTTDGSIAPVVGQVTGQYECSEQAQSLRLRPPIPALDYTAELGYITLDGRWLRLVSSAPVSPMPSQSAGKAMGKTAPEFTELDLPDLPDQPAQPMQQGGSQLAASFLVRAADAAHHCCALAADCWPQAADCWPAVRQLTLR